MPCLSYADFAWQQSALEDRLLHWYHWKEVIIELFFLRAVLYDVMERFFDAAMLNFKKKVNYTEDLRTGYTKTADLTKLAFLIFPSASEVPVKVDIDSASS